MKQFLDFLPLIVFFVVYKMYDIFHATGALIAATALILVVTWLKYRKIEKTQWVTFILVVVFGSLTLYFHKAEFVMWKVTAIYAVFAIALLAGQFIFKKILIQSMLGKDLTLPTSIWSRLNIAWSVFFIFCGLLNLYVAFCLSEATWMNFKVFGLTAMTLIFTLLSGVYIYRHIPQEEK